MLIGIAIGTAAGLALFGGGRSATVGGSMQLTYPTDDSESARAAIERMANAMAQTNAEWAKAHPDAPCCVGCAGVRYVPPAKCRGNSMCQPVRSAAQVLAQKRGTCIDLACYDCGVHLARGKAAQVRVVHEKDAQGRPIPWQYHAVVLVDGRIEDPTAELLAETGGCGCE